MSFGPKCLSIYCFVSNRWSLFNDVYVDMSNVVSTWLIINEEKMQPILFNGSIVSRDRWKLHDICGYCNGRNGNNYGRNDGRCVIITIVLPGWPRLRNQKMVGWYIFAILTYPCNTNTPFQYWHTLAILNAVSWLIHSFIATRPLIPTHAYNTNTSS